MHIPAMMMALGYFVFSRITLPHQQMQHNRRWRHPQTSRVGARPVSQFLGADAEQITLSGALFPELTGGELALDYIAKMADSGKPYPLIDGGGSFYGLYVIESLSATRTELDRFGKARRIEFQLDLLRSDDGNRGLLGMLDLPEFDMGSDWGGLLNL